MSIPHRWSFPTDMLKSYAYLFDSVATLRTQMSEDVWRLVYDSRPWRDRKCAWSREAFYTRQRLLQRELAELDAYNERLETLRENAFELSDEEMQEALRRQEKAIHTLQTTVGQERLMYFPPPSMHIDPATKAPFQVQSDSFFCAVHALNNVARSVLFTPADMLSAIECTRTLDEQCASPEDVQLMALREGVVLLLVKLTDICDANGLASGTAFHQLLLAAGGMVVYQPNGYSTGHYVPLVRVNNHWLVYSTNSVVVHASSPDEALHTYIAHSTNVVQARHETAHAARRRAYALNQSEREPFIGLLPLPLDCLWSESTQISRAGTILVQSLLRRALSEWRLVPANGGAVQFDLWTAPPISPCAITEIAWVIGDEAGPHRCEGTNRVNVASFISTRHTIQRELNELAIALQLQKNANRDDLLALLRQVRSYLRSTPAIDCLFGVVEPNESYTTSQMAYSYALFSNRRWFRHIALLLATTPLIGELEREERVSQETWSFVRLFTLLCHSNLFGSGVPTPPEIIQLTSGLSFDGLYKRQLPWHCVPAPLAAQIERDGLSFVRSFQSYHASLWLLRALPGPPLFNNQPAVLAAFELRGYADADRNLFESDRAALLVRILRTTLFRLPIEAPQDALGEQWAFESDVLASRNMTSARRFVTHCRQAEIALDVDELHDIIDVLAFDRHYLDANRERGELVATDAQPRILERAARDGFDRMYARSFGRYDTVRDARAPATLNSERISLPQVPDQWHTARIIAPILTIASLRSLTPDKQLDDDVSSRLVPADVYDRYRLR